MLAMPSEQHSRDWLSRARGRSEDGFPLPRRDLGDALRSPEIRVLLAWIEAQFAERIWDTLAQFESAWLSIRADVEFQARDLGSIANSYLPPDVDPRLRQLFALPSNQAQAVLLGERDLDGTYRPGWAQFTEAEFSALVLWLEPLEERDGAGHIQLRLREPWEIARDMTSERTRRRFGRRVWLQEDTVERYLRGARAKLRLLFGVDHPQNESGRTVPAEGLNGA